MKRARKTATLLLALCAGLPLSGALRAQETSDPKRILEEYFWGMLYKDGGTTFYCDKPFSKKGILVTEGYIYSTSWIRDHLRCGTPQQCRDHNENYRRITSDLHNIVPADARLELERRNAKFEALPDSIQPDACGLKRSFQIIEPPDALKGDIARVLLYMSETYNLPIMGNLHQIKEWSRIDPPSPEEIDRNLRIKNIQGNENRFVSNPAAVEAFGD